MSPTAATATLPSKASKHKQKTRRTRSRPRTSDSPLARATVIQEIPAHSSKVLSIAWSQSGNYLATAAQHGTVKMFYLLRGKRGALRLNPIRTFRGHTADVLAMAFSRSDFLLTASMDRSVRLWHADTALCLRRFVHPDIVTAVAFHPADENYVISGGCDGVARVWKPAVHACVAEENVGAVVTAAEFGPEGDCAYVGTYDGHVKVLNVKGLVEGDGGMMGSAELAERTHGSDDDLKPAPGVGVKKIVDVGVGGNWKLGKAGKAGGVAGMAVDEARGEVVVSGADGRVTLMNGGVDARVVGKVKVGGKKGEAGGVRLGGSVSADGRYLVFDGVGGLVRVVDLEAGRERLKRREVSVGVDDVGVIEGGVVSCAAFATRKAVEVAGLAKEAGAMLLAVGGDDGKVRIVTVDDE